MLIPWTLREEGIEVDTEQANLFVYYLFMYFLVLGIDFD